MYLFLSLILSLPTDYTSCVKSVQADVNEKPKPPDVVLCVSMLNELAISLSNCVDLNIRVKPGYR